MNEDRFFDEVRGEARKLRFEPDAFMQTRISAAVRERVGIQPTPALFLARWFRPLAASLSVVAIAATVGVVWSEQRTEPPTVESLMAGNSVEISVAGDNFSVGD